MANALRIIGDNISTWWTFMWQTDIPGTSFSFGALYLFVVLLSLFIMVLRIASAKDQKEGK